MNAKIRLTPPTDFSTFYNEKRIPASETGILTNWTNYYSGDYSYKNVGSHTGNCTWYAFARSSEIANKNILKELVGQYEAHQWVNYVWKENKVQTSGKIDYQFGDILIYANSKRTGGHVEIVESVDDKLTISYSCYSGNYPQSKYGCFFGIRKRKLMNFGDSASDTTDKESRYTRNNGETYYITNEYLIGVLHNPYVKGDTKDYKKLYEEAQAKLEKIRGIVNAI